MFQKRACEYISKKTWVDLLVTQLFHIKVINTPRRPFKVNQDITWFIGNR
jgi:hypothetical protein